MNIGGKLKLAIPKTDKSLLGEIPRFKTLTVSGIFDFGMYEYDVGLVFISLELAQRLLLFEDNHFNRVEFYLKNPLLVDKFKSQVDLNITNKSLSLIQRVNKISNPTWWIKIKPKNQVNNMAGVII